MPLCHFSASVRLHAFRRPEQKMFLSVAALMLLADRDLSRTFEDVRECLHVHITQQRLLTTLSYKTTG